MMHEKQLCPVCLKSGRRSNLTSFQVNFDEALWLCEYKRCIYPLGQDSEPTFNRTLDDIPSEKDIQTRAPSAQVALQMQVANRLTECHQKIQKDVIGIQTGSPLFMKTKARQKGLKHGSVSFNSLQNGGTHRSIGSQGLQNGYKHSSGQSGSFLNCVKSSSVNGANNHLQSFTASSLLNGNSVASDFLNGNLVTSDVCYPNIEKNNVFEGLQLGKSRVNGLTDQVSTTNGTASFNQPLMRNSNIPPQKGMTVDPNIQYPNLKRPLQNGYSTIDKDCSTANQLLMNGCVIQNSKPFLQWKNKDALCWLDVLLCLLVHNKTLKQTVSNGKQKDTLIYKLIQAHKQATLLLTNQNSVGGVKEQSVDQKSSQVATQTREIKVSKKCSNNQNNVDGSDTTLLQTSLTDPGEILDTIRDEIWGFLQNKVHCEKGKPSSPVLALPVLLQSEPTVDKVFRLKYKFVYECPKCKFLEDINCESVLPSLPAVVKDFNICTPVHKKKCLNCSYTKGQRQMLYKMLPQSFMMHFIEGLPPGKWSELEFNCNNVSYTVTGVVQYRRNPDHFVAWLRNPTDNTWLECDGLKLPMSMARVQPPKFPWKQIHIIMWEQVQNVCVNGIPALQETLTAMKDCTVTNISQKTDKPQVRNGCLANINSITNGVTLTNSSATKQTKPVIPNTSSSIKDQSDSLLTHFKHTSVCVSLESAFNQTVSSLQPGLLNGIENLGEQNCQSDNSLPKQQISIDTHKFLNSSTLSTENSSTVGRTGSSLSSTCSELSDNVSLPEFISTAQLGNDLVKPIPCRNESPVQNSDFLSRNVCEADPHINQTFNKSDKNNTVTNKTQRSLNCSITKTDKRLENICEMVVPDIKPSSVFKSPVKCALNTGQPSALDKPSSKVVSDTQSFINSLILPTAVEKLESSCVLKSETEKTVPSPADVKVEPKADNTGLSKNARFKFPSLLRMKSKPSQISRDAFQTLTKSISKKDYSPTTSPRMSPAKTLAPSPYLSAVKHYLINKTTDSAQSKTRFEGLSLKSAPILNKTVDLSDLKRNDASSSTSASPSTDTSSQKSKTDTSSPKSKTETSSQKSKTKINKDNLLKRRKEISLNDTVVKKQKTSLKYSQSTPDLIAHKPIYNPKDGSVKTKGHTIVHVTPDKRNNQIQKVIQTTVDSSRHTQPYNKENGNLLVTPEKMKNMDSETDSVLQDLYDALNIPFTSIKDTMSDIMVDVNDILGVMETTDLNTATPHKTDNLHSTGNQGQLDCGQSMTSRLKPQSGLMAQNIDWSAWTSVNKLLIIS